LLCIDAAYRCESTKQTATIIRPRLQHFSDAAAEVLGWLVKASRDYQQKGEKLGEAKRHNKNPGPEAEVYFTEKENLILFRDVAGF
jgi:hypothetical protein